MSASPLRVLVVHNAYQQRGGEDAVVEAESEMLKRFGNHVRLYSKVNDDIQYGNRFLVGLAAAWSRRTVREVDSLIDEFAPNVIHAHNTFPLISPALFWIASRRGIPTVVTLHNFRVFCAQGSMLRDGRVCEDCLGHSPWRAFVHGCYRNSRIQSAAGAFTIQSHRWLRTWANKVDMFIALSRDSREIFVRAGLPIQKIEIKPNFLERQKPVGDYPREGFLFVGRLSPEKGLATLKDAIRMSQGGLSVRVAGGGPEMASLSDVDGIELLGPQSPETVKELMRRSRAVIVPSIWRETFGMVVIEAFAAGTPVIASRIGALPELVKDMQNGLLVAPGDAGDLAGAMKWMETHQAEAMAMGSRARLDFEREFSTDTNYGRLIEIYQRAQDSKDKTADECAVD